MHGLGSPSLILLPGLADFLVNTMVIGRDSPLRSSTIFSCKIGGQPRVGGDSGVEGRGFSVMDIAGGELAVRRT